MFGFLGDFVGSLWAIIRNCSNKAFLGLSIWQNGFRFFGKLSLGMSLFSLMNSLMPLLLLDCSLEHRLELALLISWCWKRDNKRISWNNLRKGVKWPSDNHINVLPRHHKRHFCSTLRNMIIWVIEVLILRFRYALHSLWLFLSNDRNIKRSFRISQISINFLSKISFITLSGRLNLILLLRIGLHLIDSFIDPCNLLSPLLHILNSSLNPLSVLFRVLKLLNIHVYPLLRLSLLSVNILLHLFLSIQLHLSPDFWGDDLLL